MGIRASDPSGAPGRVSLSRYRITFVLNDGSVTDISLPAHRYLVVMKWLNRVLPHAEFGMVTGAG